MDTAKIRNSRCTRETHALQIPKLMSSSNPDETTIQATDNYADMDTQPLEYIEPPTKVAKLVEVTPADSETVHKVEVPILSDNNSKVDTESGSTNNLDTSESFRRGRTILSFGYLGEGYQGLQANSKAKTIEPVLLEAMLKAGAIDPNHSTFDDVRWDRCARTDKGVSAACNYVSLNIKYGRNWCPRCFPDLIEKINANLPDTMRFWHFQRVGKSFRAHIRAGGRRYQYVLPTSLFHPNSLPKSTQFHFDTQMRERVQSVLDRFVGTHRFHHYTQSISYKDDQANRTIHSFVCGEPFVMSGIEWVKLTVVGTSFVLNQIRKMVACVVAVIKEDQQPSVVDATFENIPPPGLQIAPGEGLYLDECLYDSHNRTTEPPNEPITVDAVRPQIQAFIEQKIFPSIAKHEVEDQVFTKWLDILHEHPMNWEKVVKDAEDSILAAKEHAFAEAKRKGLASARGVSTAEEFYQRTKGATIDKCA